MADKQLRCAIYTHKSAEGGLDQEFNSLDAEYEGCAAYAVSQRHDSRALLAADLPLDWHGQRRALGFC